MFRTITYLAAAALLTTGAVAAMAGQPDAAGYKVSVGKQGTYCITTPAVTGSMIDKVECRTADDWQKDGITISRR